MKKIKNIEKAAARIRQAVEQKEKIVLYGDSDCDGITSVAILKETIQNLGGTVADVFFPDREGDGYGVNARGLEVLKKFAPNTTKKSTLFITLDLGITNNKEVLVLNSMGFSVIIVDHHQILNGIPSAEIVIDPQQEGDESGCKHLANVGITFKLAEEMLGKSFFGNVKNSFLELAALATISDMVPQIEDNKMFIEEGLRSLKRTFRPGLRAFLDILGEGEVVSGGYYKIISALNAAESIDFQNEAYALLVSSSPKICQELAENLIAKTNYKQLKIQEIAGEVERRIAQKKPARSATGVAGGDSPIIFEGDPSWRLVLAGPVASIIGGSHKKPTFIFKKGDSESSGSVRCPKGLNSVEAMKTCADILITYGGHPQASGFRIKNENLEAFKKGLITFFEENRK